MTDRTHLSIYISDLSAGGAERMALELSRKMEKSNVTTSLVTTSFKRGTLNYRVDDGIKVINVRDFCSKNYVIFQIQRLLFLSTHLKKMKHASHVSFVTQVNLLLLISGILAGTKIIIAERNNIAFEKHSRLVSFLRKCLYRFSKCLVVQTKEIQAACQQKFPECKVQIIRNFIREFKPQNSENDLKIIKQLDGFNYIITTGRFSAEKRLDFIIKSFSLLPQEIIKRYKLVIIGHGALGDYLKDLASQLNLSTEIVFFEDITDVFSYLDQASLYVHAAKYEGFPNAVAEAVVAKLPVLMTDCRSGCVDLGEGLVDFEVMDSSTLESDFAQKMRLLLINSESFSTRRDQNLKIIRENFSDDKITSDWLRALGLRDI